MHFSFGQPGTHLGNAPQVGNVASLFRLIQTTASKKWRCRLNSKRIGFAAASLVLAGMSLAWVSLDVAAADRAGRTASDTALSSTSAPNPFEVDQGTCSIVGKRYTLDCKCSDGVRKSQCIDCTNTKGDVCAKFCSPCILVCEGRAGNGPSCSGPGLDETPFK